MGEQEVNWLREKYWATQMIAGGIHTRDLLLIRAGLEIFFNTEIPDEYQRPV